MQQWNNMHAFTSLSITLLLLAMAGADDSKALSLMREANDQFTAKLFSEVPKSGSFVISAFSVFTPLSLLSIASDGKTHEELLKTLGFQNDKDLKAAIPTVASKLGSVKGIDIKMANRIYIPLGYELNDNFSKTSRDVFDSEVKNADFSNSKKTVAEINRWVESQTNNKIKDLVNVKQVNEGIRAMLVNAIYFKGKWNKKFNKALTDIGKFYKTKSETTEVSYMSMEDHLYYAENDELNAKILKIPYTGQEASFVVILPNEIDGLDALGANLKDPAVLRKATRQLEQFKVHVTLPKFKIETTTDLIQALKKMGIEKIFTSEAETTKLLKTNERSIYVSSATQKAFIEINEEGTEAAAANIVFAGKPLAMKPLSRVEFKADHPFIFMVEQSDITLFSGAYKA